MKQLAFKSTHNEIWTPYECIWVQQLWTRIDVNNPYTIIEEGIIGMVHERDDVVDNVQVGNVVMDRVNFKYVEKRISDQETIFGTMTYS